MEFECSAISFMVNINSSSIILKFEHVMEDNLCIYLCSIHFCITYCQTEPGVADRFVQDVKDTVRTIMKDPGQPSSGAVS
jgi:hypothetical protein